MEDEPLPWWKSECVRYPVLAKVAKKFLCLCATSVPSERVFSCGGHIVSDRRTCLKPQRVDSLVFLAQNLKWTYSVTVVYMQCNWTFSSCFYLFLVYCVPIYTVYTIVMLFVPSATVHELHDHKVSLTVVFIILSWYLVLSGYMVDDISYIKLFDIVQH